MGKKRLAQKLQDWVQARQRFDLSHAQVQMARELGLNPKKLGKIEERDDEPWKLPLPRFLENLYFKRFGRKQPEIVMSIEERARLQDARKEARKQRRRQDAQGGGHAPAAN